MSTIKSSNEHLTFNADGSGKEVRFQANGTQKASISSAGAFTSTTIDATVLTGALPAISGASLTGILTGITDNSDATAITIDSSERVGIGTASPDQKLHVVGNAVVTGIERIGDGTASSPAYQFVSDTNTGMFRIGTDQLGFSTAGGQAMMINANGLVGIGTNASANNLEIWKATGASLRIQGGNNDSDAYIRMQSGNISGESYIALGDEDDWDIGKISYLNNGNHMVFTTNTSEAMRLTSAGNAIFTGTITSGDKTTSSSDPTATTNPSAVGHHWINSTSGESYICNDATNNDNVWINIASGSGDINNTIFHTATGGTITTHGNYKVHTFLSSGTFEITTLGTAASVDILAVAGGGTGGTYTVVSSYVMGVDGNNTTGIGKTAIAGGGGGAYPSRAGRGGGSGGGGSSPSSSGGAGTSGQGNAGGAKTGSSNSGGGGGGGAGAVGDSGTDSRCGDGGAGIQNNYRTGSNVYYGGGGGGASGNQSIDGGAGGAGGGGAGGDPTSNGGADGKGIDGTANTGGGGGAGDYGWGAGHGGGGAGGVIVDGSVSVSATSYSIVIGAGGVHPDNTANNAGHPGDGGSGIFVIRYLIA